MGTEKSIHGFGSILLAFAIVLSMAISVTLTAPTSLAAVPFVIDEPGGTTITVYPGQTFTLQFKLQWNEPAWLGYFSLGIQWDSPKIGSSGTASENFTLENVSVYFEDNGDPISPIGVSWSQGVAPDNASNWRYAVIVDHTAGDGGDDNFFVDIVMSASGVGGVPHVPTNNHPIVIVGTIDVVESGVVSYSPPDPIITVRVVPPLPSQSTLFSPADGTRMDNNTPTFEWTNGSNADNHRLLVDNDPDFLSPEIDNTFLVSENTFAPTIALPDENYSWKVIAQNAVGENHSDKWTFIIDTTPPAAPTLVWPDNGENINDNTPNLDWGNVSDNSEPVLYRVHVSDNSKFPYDDADSGWISADEWEVTTQLTDGIWYWRVQAKDDAGNVGENSVPRSFRVDTLMPYPVSPPDGIKTNDNTPIFIWENKLVADNYELWVNNDPTFELEVSAGILENTTDNYRTIMTELTDGTYYWRVRAYKGAKISVFSPVRTLLIDATSPMISGVTASNITQNSAVVTWTTDEPSNSVVEYGTTPLYGLTVLDDALVTNHFVSLSGLSAGTTYHYRVKSTDAANNTTTSLDYTFTTSSPPPLEDTTPPLTPSLASPTNGTNITDNTPLLDWSDVSDPSGVIYDLFISRDAAFASIAIQKTDLSTSTYELTPAEALATGTYYWRARAVDGVGNIGLWSEKWSFTVYVSPTPATLTVDTTPIKASVYVDNIFWGIAPQTRSVTAGSYIVSSGDYLGYFTPPPQTVTLTTGETRAVTSTYTEIPPELIENESPPIDIPSITPDENATIEVENNAITGMTIDVEGNVENVRITVQQLTDKPAEIIIGAPGVTYCYLNIVSENITDVNVNIVLINFRVEKAWITAENINPDSIVMRRWNPIAGVWVSLPTARIGEDGRHHYYRAESLGLSIFGITGFTLAPSLAEFEFSNLVADPNEVKPGDAVTVSVVVMNVGDIEGTCTVTLKIDNVVEATENLTLPFGATETVTVIVSRDVEGTYDVEVDGLSGTFVVTLPAPPPIVPLAITGGIVFLAGILIWLIRRRTKKGLAKFG